MTTIEIDGIEMELVSVYQSVDGKLQPVSSLYGENFTPFLGYLLKPIRKEKLASPEAAQERE